MLRNLLDSLYCRLHAPVVCCNAKPTEALTQEDEGKLWDSGVLNQNMSQGLLNCVFFLNGKNFCLGRDSEHCEFKLSQFCCEVVKVDGQSMVQYSEHESKNWSGGLKELRTANKVAHQYESNRMDRCHAHILGSYILKLLNGEKQKDVFYLKPRTITPKDHSAPWFMLIPLGWISLGAMMKTMASQGQLGKDVINNSPRAYAVTKMFSAKVPE